MSKNVLKKEQSWPIIFQLSILTMPQTCGKEKKNHETVFQLTDSEIQKLLNLWSFAVALREKCCPHML